MKLNAATASPLWSQLIRADGEPERLMAEMGVNIVEVRAPALRALKEKLLQRPQVRSAAQLVSAYAF